MWDPHHDMENDSKDLPCNTQLYFRVVDNKLTMTILNRSNDLVWGMLGANIVHMSILQEYIAGCTDFDIGPMYQFTNNLHVYEGWGGDDKISLPSNWYANQRAMPQWSFNDHNFDVEEASDFVEYFQDDDDRQYKSRILRDNAMPMYLAYKAFKSDDLPLAMHHANKIYDGDWNHACMEWLRRREK
jgi:hypothetical protein